MISLLEEIKSAKGIGVDISKKTIEKIKNGEQETFVYMPDTLIPLSKEELEYEFHHIDTDYVEISVYESDTIICEEKIDIDGIV